MGIKDKLNDLKNINPELVDSIVEKSKNAASVSANKAQDLAVFGIEKAVKGKEIVDKKVEVQKQLSFTSLDSLKPVVNVVNEATMALNDKTRNIKTSSIPSVLTGTLGAGLGSALSFAALYGFGTAGLSAAGITSGLAAVGGTMVGGIFVLAAPVAIGAGVGVGIAYNRRQKQLKEEKERLYKEALLKHEAIVQELESEAEADKERVDYLTSLNILLQQALKELKHDIDLVNE